MSNIIVIFICIIDIDYHWHHIIITIAMMMEEQRQNIMSNVISEPLVLIKRCDKQNNSDEIL